MNQNNLEEEQQEYMIALFYTYTSNPVPVKEHMEFQKRAGTELFLGGRIRVSVEGINGVVSGTRRHLQKYEQLLQAELICTETLTTEAAEMPPHIAPNTSNSSSINLNMKYCKLRPDLPFKEQLFDRFRVQETRQVVTMDDENLSTAHQTITTNSSVLADFDRAPHLSPEDWHAQLIEKSISSVYCKDDEEPETDAILMDIRNVYESKVGYFEVKGVTTLLTNTRNYSSLPRVLEACIPQMSGKTIYMYCTGGVRCERASQYIKMLAATSPQWKELPPPKQIYQLDGGIQKYLEKYSMKSVEEKEESAAANNSHENSNSYTCLFRGKNFVFDQRRTDPMVGSSTKNVVGSCLVCHSIHDDYDNGYAPCAGREARCCRCRVLILVCSPCRQIYKCWGEKDEDEHHPKPELFCGMKGLSCVDKGNHLEAIQIVKI